MNAYTLSYLVLSIVAMHITFFAISGIILIIRNREQRDRSRRIFYG